MTIHWALTSLALAAVWLAAGPSRADPAADFAPANAELAKHTDEAGFLDADPATPAILQRVWRAAESVAAQAANSQPPLRAALAALGKDVEAQVVSLGPATWLVSLRINGDGDVFVVKGGAVAWRIADPRPQVATMRPLQAWTPTGEAPDCGAHATPDDWADCGHLTGEVGRAPDDASGRARFWVDAAYAQAAGETESGQISFWSWDGAHATPLLLRTYQLHIELDGAPTLTGDVVSRPVKGDFLSFLACGACAGRQLTWRFRLTGDGVHDLGQASAVPELDLIDRIYHRAAHRQSLAGLAAPAPARVIAKVVVDGDATSQWPMGALDDWALSADRRRLCVATDSGGAVEFTLGGTRGRPMVIAAKRVEAGLCGDAEHWPGMTSGS